MDLDHIAQTWVHHYDTSMVYFSAILKKVCCLYLVIFVKFLLFFDVLCMFAEFDGLLKKYSKVYWLYLWIISIWWVKLYSMSCLTCYLSIIWESHMFIPIIYKYNQQTLEYFFNNPSNSAKIHKTSKNSKNLTKITRYRQHTFFRMAEKYTIDVS